MFILLLEHAILYPECINTKTSTVRCMRWEKSHLYCVATRTRQKHRCFCTMFKQGERVFLLSASVAISCNVCKHCQVYLSPIFWACQTFFTMYYMVISTRHSFYKCVSRDFFLAFIDKKVLHSSFFFFYKNVVFTAQAEYPYFSADFRLKYSCIILKLVCLLC